MGCCGAREDTQQTNEGNPDPKKTAAAETKEPPKEMKPQAKPEVSPKPADVKAEVKSQSPGLILHTNSQSAPRFDRVFSVLAGNTRIERRVTPDLGTIGALIKRYPVAEINGKFLTGERVIARYLAQQRALYPIGPVQIYECESLVEQLEDMWKSLDKADDQCVYTAAELLQAVERRLKPEQKYYGGDKPNYADVVVFCFLTTFFLSDTVREDREGAVPKRLRDLVELLKAQPLFKQV